MKRFVYLAGPIAGLDAGEATDWRDYTSVQLSEKSNGQIVGVSPLRCEPPNREGKYDDQLHLGDRQEWFVTPRAINGKNWYDTVNCDAVLVYFPKRIVENRPSYGTVIEAGWAVGMRKPLFVVSDEEYFIKHPLIDRNAICITDSLDEVIHNINSILEVYT